MEFTFARPLRSLAVSTLILGTMACGSAKPIGLLSEDVAESAAATQPLDHLADIEKALRATKTQLTLSPSDLQSLTQVLPRELAQLLNPLLSADGVQEIRILGQEALATVSFANEAAQEWRLSDDLALNVDELIQIIGVQTNIQGEKYLQIRGVRLNGQVVSGVVPQNDGALNILMQDAASQVVPAATWHALVQSQENHIKAVTPHHLVLGFLRLLRMVHAGGKDNSLHIIAKESMGKNLGQPNRGNAYRRLLRQQVEAMGAAPEYLAIFDSITDVMVDSSGIQLWLTDSRALSFEPGRVIIGKYAQLTITQDLRLLAQRGVQVAANDRGVVARMDHLKYHDYGTWGRFDAQVSGYKDVLLLGRRGQTYNFTYDVK